MFLQRTNKLGGHYLKKIKSRSALAVLRLVQSEEDRAELASRLKLMSDWERQATAVIITQEVASSSHYLTIQHFKISTKEC